jgi:site-specific DNA recombinase
LKNVVAYYRVSTQGQLGEDKFGIEAQKEQIIAYCEKNDLNIMRWYWDEGESGAKYRPGFDEIVYGDICNPPVEAVVVAHSDRVARDINIYFYYRGALARKDIELISVCTDFGQFGVFADMLEAFTLIQAKMERESINKRTSAGRLVKAGRGGYSGGRPPYGYRSIDRKLTIDENEAEIVREIFRMKDGEAATYKSICEYLNSIGALTRKGERFAISTIQQIYENRKTYLGFYKYGKNGEWVRGMHEAILSEDFSESKKRKKQEIEQKEMKRTKHGTKHETIYSAAREAYRARKGD